MNWISVKDKLPEIMEDVLIRVKCLSYYNVEQGCYKGNDEWINCWYSRRNKNLYPVSHWMPLPDSPK
mgnify:CR=1 FL=1